MAGPEDDAKAPHPIAVELVREALAPRLSRPWYVRTQAPHPQAGTRLSDGEAEPDLALVRGDRRDYLQHHPGPGNVVLVVEVADTSLARDRGIKKQTYALAGIPTYWIVNLLERKIERYTEPSGTEATPDYTQRRDFGITEAIPVVIDGVEIGQLEVRELLP
jgi:Uma2 family endonuclease